MVVYNMVSIEEARKRAQEDNPTVTMRSCWNCNPSHEHLKNSDCVIMCLECGEFYYLGVKISEG